MKNHFKKDIYTKQDILSQLSAMEAPRGGVVLMHSSLRAVGAVMGGAEALLDAMIEYFTADGGLFCVPTHTWKFFDREIVLDMTVPETCLGAFSVVAMNDPRGIRSEHPSHSMVVFGDRKRAEEFISEELTLDSCTSPHSCYGKIYRDGGHILLVGVSHNRNTYLHSVEEILGVGNRLTAEPMTLRVKRMNGEVVECRIREHHTDFTKDVSLRFPKYETAFRYHGCITDGFIGNAPTQLCDARGMKDVMEMIFERCGDTDPLYDEASIPQEWYCTKH